MRSVQEDLCRALVFGLLCRLAGMVAMGVAVHACLVHASMAYMFVAVFILSSRAMVCWDTVHRGAELDRMVLSSSHVA